jgi:hypothetical protein
LCEPRLRFDLTQDFATLKGLLLLSRVGFRKEKNDYFPPSTIV